MTLRDQIALGLLAMIPILMAVAIILIRRDLQRSKPPVPTKPAHRERRPVHLKTTDAQRQQWRMGKQRHPHAIIDLADDIDTLLKRVEDQG